MSKQVDDRVVSMQFDNSNFEKNVKTSMSTLDKLKEALNFKGATKGLEAVESASKKVDFSSMSNAVDEVGVRFNSLQVIAATALGNITNSVLNAGKQIVSALTIDPLKSGFSEYETQIGSIQTILTNTAHEGTNVKQVSAALDELNTYADKTIYNFTEMTKNIGTFTAAGVDLDTSVQAIKGIANLAAASGSTSAQASSAMYQLSQALAAGRVSLMDWNSVLTAGMGGKLFQDALIRTSEVMGTGAEAAIEQYGSFRESLTRGQWLTSEVLTETLKQFAGSYSEAELASKGYTESQIADIKQMQQNAENAATEVKTFSALIGTTMEVLGSGWTNSWELIIGDYEEAKTLFTDMNNVISTAVNESANARNAMLQGWRDLGGRDALFEGLSNAFDGLMSVVTPIKEAFTDIFPPMTAETLYNITDSFRNFTKNLKLDDTAAENLKNTFKGLFSVIKSIGEGFMSLVTGGIDIVGSFSGIIDGILGFTGNIGTFVSNIGTAIGVSEGFGGVINNIATAFKNAATSVGNFLSSGFSKVGDLLGSITPDQINTVLNALGTGVLAKFGIEVGKAIKNFTGSSEEATGAISGIFGDITSSFSESVTGVLDSVRDALASWQSSIQANTLIKIAVAVGILAASISELSSIDPSALNRSLGAVTVLFGELVGAMTLFTKVTTGFDSAGSLSLVAMAGSIFILAKAMGDLAELDTDQIERGITAIAGLATIMVVAAKALSLGKGSAIEGAAGLVLMAAAIKILASALNDISSLNMDQINTGLTGIAGVAVTMSVFSQTVKSDGLIKASVAMIAVGAAMEIMADVFTKMQSLDVNSLSNSLVAIGVVLGEVAAFSNLVKSDGIVKAGASLILAAGAINLIALAINSLAGLGIEQLGVALAGLGGGIALLFAGLKAVSGSEKSVGALLLAAVALNAIGLAINVVSAAGIEGVVIALGAFAGVFITFGAATAILKPLVPTMYSLAGAIAAFGAALIPVGAGIAAVSVGFAFGLTSIAGAFVALSTSLSGLDLGTVAIGLIAIVGGVAAFAGASVLLAPVLPLMIGLAAAITLLGVACTAVAAGIYLFSQAIAVLGAVGPDAASGFVGTITSAITGVLDAIPEMATSLGQALASILLAALDTLVQVAPALASSLLQIITEILASLSQYGPQIIDYILVFFIQIIDGVAARIPELVGSISNLVSSLFTAITDALSGWTQSGDALNTGMEFLGGLSALVVIFNVVGGMVPGAMAAAVKIAAFGVEIAAIIAAFGALQQIPGLSWLIGEGGNMLQNIGTAIGQFVGGIIGGVLEGATSTLPQVGQSLSDFAANVTPFLNAMSNVDQSTIDGVTNLALAIAALSGANFVDSITSFLTGGTDFSGLVEKLIPFGEAMVQFSNTVDGINVDAINASANAAQALGTLASSLPKEGGLAQAIFGESVDMGTFATQMVQFGLALKMYGAAVEGLNVESITASATAGQALSDLANSLPKDGGLASAIFGESTDMDDFATQIVPFGQALASYAAVVTGLNVESIQNSAKAGQALSDLANSLPDEGGLAEWIFGGSSLDDFGTKLSSFGGALVTYTQSLANVDFEKINQSVTAVTSLKDVLQAFVGLDTSGVENLSVLEDIGSALDKYYSYISGYEVESLGASVSSLVGLKDFINSLSGLDTSGISSFSQAIEQLGQISLDGLVNTLSSYDLSGAGHNLALTFSNGFKQGLESVKTDVDTIITNVTSSISSQTQSFSTAGQDSSAAYATGIQNGVVSVTTAVTNMVNSAASSLGGNYSTFYNAGYNLAQGFAQGISSGSFSATIAARAMASAAANAARAALDEHSPSKVLQKIGEYFGQGFVIGVESYNDEAYDAGKEMTSFAVEGASNLFNLYDSFGDLGSKINELTALSKQFSTVKEKDTKSTSSDTEEHSKLAEALSSVAESTQKLLDRREDLNGFQQIIERVGSSLSGSFIGELLSAEGTYAGALDEMVNLTDEQLTQLGEIYDQSQAAERMEDFYTQISDSMKEIATSSKNFDAIESLFTRTGVNFSRGFMAELLDFSGEYADVMSEIIQLTDEDLQKLSDLYDQSQATQRMEDFYTKISETMTTITDNTAKLEAMQSLFTRTGVSFSDGFMAELLDSSGEYADVLTELVQLTDEDLQRISDLYDQSAHSQGMLDFTSMINDTLSDVKKTKKRFSDLNAIINRSGVEFSEAFVREVADSGGQYADILDYMATATDEQLQFIADAYDEAQIYEAIDELTSTLMGDKGLAFALENSGIKLDDFAEKIAAFGLDITDVTGKISDFADTVADGFSAMSTENQTGMDDFKSNLRGNIDEARNWEKNVEAVFAKLGDYQYADEFRKAILEGGYDKYGKLMADMAESSKEEIIDVIELWNTAGIYGAQLGQQVVNSLVPDQSVTQQAGYTVAGAMTSSVSEGITEGTPTVVESMENLCATTTKIAQDYFNADSFKMLTEQIANVMNKLSEGIRNVAQSIYDSMTKLQNMLASMQASYDSQKSTISPVLDTTDAANKASILNSSLGSSLSSGVIGTVATINANSQNGYYGIHELSDSILTLSDKIDEIDSGKFGTTFNQYNTSPKALSTADIYRQTKNQISLAKSRVGKNPIVR